MAELPPLTEFYNSFSLPASISASLFLVTLLIITAVLVRGGENKGEGKSWLKIFPVKLTKTELSKILRIIKVSPLLLEMATSPA